MPKRKTRTKKTSSRRATKGKLAGFTKVGGKFRLVFRKDRTLKLGTKKFSSKRTLFTAAAKLKR